MPEIISRKDAIAQGLNKYFTGKPCKNGHLAERYVQSATCEGCLRPTSALSRISHIAIEGQVIIGPDPRLEIINRRLAIQEIEAENERRRIAIKEQSMAFKSQSEEDRIERKIAREKRRFIKENMVPVNILAIGDDYPVAVSIVWMAALMRNPQITKEDVLTGRMKDGHYVMRCFPEDKELLIKQTYNLYSQHHADVERSREQAIASTQAAETAEIEAEWPEFRP